MPSSRFLFSKHSNICFATSFCILTFPLGGFIRNMNVLLGDMLLIFIRTLEANQYLQTLYFQNIVKGANKIKIQSVGNWMREDANGLGMGLKTV